MSRHLDRSVEKQTGDRKIEKQIDQQTCFLYILVSNYFHSFFLYSISPFSLLIVYICENVTSKMFVCLFVCIVLFLKGEKR